MLGNGGGEFDALIGYRFWMQRSPREVVSCQFLSLSRSLSLGVFLDSESYMMWTGHCVVRSQERRTWQGKRNIFLIFVSKLSCRLLISSFDAHIHHGGGGGESGCTEATAGG